MGESDNPRYVNSTGQQRVSDAYQQKANDLENRVGAVQIDPDLSDEELVTTVRRLAQANNIKFTSESSAVYHAHKHYGELPLTERTRGENEMDSYFKSAQQTIADGTAIVSMSQTGSRSIKITNEVIGALELGGREKRIKLTAFLYVFPDGRVVLASYQGIS